VSKSVNLTGGNWELEERHKDRHRKKLGLGGSDAPDERYQPPPHPSTFIYTVHMCIYKLDSYGPSHVVSRRKDAMVSYFSILTVLV
jgi:hypothetical protein